MTPEERDVSEPLPASSGLPVEPLAPVSPGEGEAGTAVSPAPQASEPSSADPEPTLVQVLLEAAGKALLLGPLAGFSAALLAGTVATVLLALAASWPLWAAGLAGLVQGVAAGAAAFVWVAGGALSQALRHGIGSLQGLVTLVLGVVQDTVGMSETGVSVQRATKLGSTASQINRVVNAVPLGGLAGRFRRWLALLTYGAMLNEAAKQARQEGRDTITGRDIGNIAGRHFLTLLADQVVLRIWLVQALATLPALLVALVLLGLGVWY